MEHSIQLLQLQCINDAKSREIANLRAQLTQVFATHTHTHTHVQAQICTYTHKYTYTRTHTCTNACTFMHTLFTCLTQHLLLITQPQSEVIEDEDLRKQVDQVRRP